jgi:hypothetical protein
LLKTFSPQINKLLLSLSLWICERSKWEIICDIYTLYILPYLFINYASLPGLIFKRFGYEYRNPFVCPAIQFDHLIQLVFSEALCNGHDYYITNTKHFPCWYTVISTRMEIGKTRNCVETRRPKGGVFSHNFEFSQFPRVLI